MMKIPKIPDKVLKISLHVIAFIIIIIIIIVIPLPPLYSESELRNDVQYVHALKNSLDSVKNDVQYVHALINSLDSANTALQKSLKEYKLLKKPCCEHICLPDSTTKKVR